jgi:CheY-like chemotaxis protein
MQRILLMGDGRLLRIATVRLLNRSGYQITCAGEGEEALLATGRGRPNC